jgi:hypothetical protein
MSAILMCGVVGDGEIRSVGCMGEACVQLRLAGVGRS